MLLESPVSKATTPMTPRSNDLLAHLPDAEYIALTQHMNLVSLEKGQTLFSTGKIPDFIHYPVDAIVSMMNDMADGFSVETYMIGKAGMVGVGALTQPSFYRAFVRNSGFAYRIATHTLLQIRTGCPVYLQGEIAAMNRMVMQLSQGIACGKHHSTESQLIRWMLITLDRTPMLTIPSTHQEISDILGFRRESITLALQKLSDMGYISTHRGKIKINDREALEELVCDCYWIGQQRAKRSDSACCL